MGRIVRVIIKDTLCGCSIYSLSLCSFLCRLLKYFCCEHSGRKPVDVQKFIILIASLLEAMAELCAADCFLSAAL